MSAGDRLRARGRLAENVQLGPLTTYKFGGPARYLVTAGGEDDVRDAWLFAGEENVPVVALGRGSNVVVADAGYPGVVLVAGEELATREISGPEVTAGAAAPLPVLAREVVRAGWGGIEFFVGIPGSVGGAVRMNAGCHGTETADVLITARVFDSATGEVSDLAPEALNMSYRHSGLTDDQYVLSARFSIVPQDPAVGERALREITRWRREHQPGGTFNAGSVFKNPPGDAAGRIIDGAGLKGFSVGRVRVSERHANFFVADSGATAAEVHELVTEVRRRVLDVAGVDLEPEVRFVGSFE